jgi:hypothetical protein
MRTYLLAGIMAMSTVAAFGQTKVPPTNPNPATPAMTTSSTPTPASPAKGSNSFTMAQAKSRIEATGYTNVTGLKKDNDGIWRGKGSKNGVVGDVSLDYQGNVLPK